MNETEIKEVQDSWEIAKRLGVDAIGLTFYKRVFSQAPEALALFSFKDEENMFETETFKKHARNVVLTVGRAVAGLRDLDTIGPVLHALGHRHYAYGVKDFHYPIIGEALLHTVATALGDKYTPVVRAAWEGTYGLVADAMKKGSKQAEDEAAAAAAAADATEKTTSA